MEGFDVNGGAPTHPAALSCTAVDQDGTVVVVAAGELDLGSAERLWQTLAGALDAAAPVVLDCALITFCDSIGLRTLVRAHHRAQDAAGFFALAAVSTAVARVLNLAGLADAVPAFADVATARKQAALHIGRAEQDPR